MTIAELLTNEEMRRREFPVTGDKIFLAHAGDAPLPRCVADAIQDYLQLATTGDQESVIFPDIATETRALAAELLGVRPEEVALVGPTSLALSFVASGLPLRPGDNVVAYFDDYPSNVYPWMALQSQGIEVRWVKTERLGEIRLSDIEARIDANTRLVALASCHFVSGYRIDLAQIGHCLRERGIWFCVDAIQTLGAFATPAGQVDFLAADAHKWLLGPCAAGILYVRESMQETLRPPVYGWHNVRSVNYIAQDQITYRRDAHRYEAGSHNLLGMVGLNAALKLLTRLGLENISRELLRKRQWLVPALQAKGHEVLLAEAGPENASGIVTFFNRNADMTALHQKLLSFGVVTSLRVDRAGQRYIRLSPHFYNTDQELHTALELL